MLADVFYNWKMTSFMTLDRITSFNARKTLQLHVNVCDIV